MVTQLLDALVERDFALERAGILLRDGELVAIPTETVYGLAACISNTTALRNIFAVKGRPADNPLIVHIANRNDVYYLAYVDEVSEMLMKAFWPGALTLVLPRKEVVNDLVTAGLDTVAVRMPSLEITREIIQAAGEPLAAPSANISGRPSATTAQHVLDDFAGRIAAVVDAGACEQGIESTVVRVEAGRVFVLRPGGVTRTQLAAAVGNVIVDDAVIGADMPGDGSGVIASSGSPGTRHRHYAPRARVVLCDTVEDLIKGVRSAEDTGEGHGRGPGEGSANVLILAEQRPDLDVPWRPLTSPTLFAELRRADELHLDKILVHCTATVRLDEALMNRLRKASEPFAESGVDK